MKNILAGLFVLFALSFLAFVLVKKPIYSSYTPVNDSLDAEKLTTLVNEWRVKSGFQPYLKNDALCRISEDRVKDGADSHKGFVEKYYSYKSVLSENMTISPTNNGALTSWLNSTPHRKALEHNYKYSCISTDFVNSVQIFSNCENGCL
jgi:uncharacterized protein YkwD